MALSGRRLALLLCAVLLCAWLVIDAVHGGTSVQYFAPAVVLCGPLLLGRYVGEAQLVAIARGAGPRPARRVARLSWPIEPVRIMHRGGRLIASSLAKRPPPRSAGPLIA
jgi:hypothetical protein